ncbi:MAG: membrane associated rhomboid family serine protease [Myxococcota bacterium]|jgi:membrane associated rhomboid family serine protease
MAGGSNYSKCQACSSWVPRGDDVCPHCGASQDPVAKAIAWVRGLFPASERRPSRLCVSCNGLLGVDDRECPHCGVKQTAVKKALRSLRKNTPAGQSVTQWLIVAMVALFVLPLAAGGENFDFKTYLMSGDSYTGLRLGAMGRGLILVDGDLAVPVNVDTFVPTDTMAYADTIAGGQYWRLITAIFLHFSIMHIVFNAMALRTLGGAVEDLYGWGWFLFIFVVTGAVGFLLSYYSEPVRVSAGASGGIAGLLGVGVFQGWQQRMSNPKLLRTTLGWLGFAFVFSLVMSADHYAHGGGLLAGIGLAAALPPERVTRRGPLQTAGTVLGQVSVVVILVSFGAMALWARAFT